MKVLVMDNLAKDGVAVLESAPGIEPVVGEKMTPDELKQKIKGFDAIIVRSATKMRREIIEAADALKVIARAGVGLDNVDIEAATERGIVVMNSPEGNTVSTAEQTMAMILALSRNVAQAAASMREGKWDKKKYMGRLLQGKTVGVVGLGRIGSTVARRLLAFECTVIGYDPVITEEAARKLTVELVQLPELFERADIITFHTPLTDETRGLVRDETIAAMKDGVFVVNCARGGIVDEAALGRGIESGKVGGAALDVFEKEPPEDSPLAKLDNVIMTPHLGASTKEAQAQVAVDTATQVVDALTKGVMRNAVNAPMVSAEVMESLRYYLVIGEALGKLAVQIGPERIEKLEIEYAGDICQYDVTPVTIATVKGLLEPSLGESVNHVNAPVKAEEMGIRIVESRSATSEDYNSLVTVSATSADGTKTTVAGAVLGKHDPRIVLIDEYRLNAEPQGALLICRHSDKPGIVGRIGSILGDAGINIAALSLGRRERGGAELTVLNVDTSVAKDIVAKLEAIPDFEKASIVRL